MKIQFLHRYSYNDILWCMPDLSSWLVKNYFKYTKICARNQASTALVYPIKLRSALAPPSSKMWDSCNWVYMGFTTFKVEVLRLLSAYLHRAASAYLCCGALSAECKYVSEFVYLLNISSKGLVTQCPLCLNRDLCGWCVLLPPPSSLPSCGH